MSLVRSQSGYEPLPPVVHGQPSPPRTRILLLEPGETSAPLSVTLHIEDIQNCARYEAISYVWGDEISDNPILRDGQPVQIGVNLEAVFRSLRLPDKKRRLWADAICIDQNNLQEKNHQIQLMKGIYQHASRVIIWLGPAIPGVKEAFTLAALLGQKRANLRYEENDNTRISPAAGFNLTPESVKDIINPASPDWKSLSDIMDLKWWKRTWVIQEFVVSSSSVARCGDFETSMMNLLASAVYVSSWRGEQEQENLWFWNTVYLEKFREPPTSPAHWTRGRKLINLLPDVRKFQCTNPRDRLFALLGIIQEQPGGIDMWHVLNGDVGVIKSKRIESGSFRGKNEIMDQSMHQALLVEYRKPVVEVYRDITRWLIRRYHILNILSQVEHDPNVTAIEGLRLPSWVPNYLKPMVASHMAPPSWFRAGLCIGHRQYLAPDHHHRLHRRTSNMDVLSLDGFLVDRVAETTSPIFVGMSNPQNTLSFDQYWRQIFGSSVIPLKKSATTRIEEFGITLMGGVPSERPFVGPKGSVDINIDEAIPWVNKLYERLCCIVHAHLRTSHGLQNTYARREVLARSLPGDEMRFQKHARKWTYGRKLYKTTKGTFGLGPAELQPGDEVVVMIGSRIPFILRPTPDGKGWVLIGETYFHDVSIMTGKVADQIANGFSFKMKVYDIY